MNYVFFLHLALILMSAKFFGLLAKKLKAPQVVGQIIAGLVIGPCILNLTPEPATDGPLTYIAEIGVILLMFSAGLDTNLRELKESGGAAFFIACMGVLVPLGCGTLLYMAFYGFSAVGTPEFYKALFIGTIMTATSVSITVQALKELGHLKGKVGTITVSAAIIDDVIGIIVLTVVLGLSSSGSSESGSVVSGMFEKAGLNSILSVLVTTVIYFAFVAVVGLIAYQLFKKYLVKRYSKHRRVVIDSLVLCFFMAYASEHFFGIADITGAYVAGIVLCSLHDQQYINRRVDISSYMVFAPVFFVDIGLKTSFSNLNSSLIIFCICFVLVALLSKIIGCGFAAKVSKLPWIDSLKVGVGMMTRGEVALIVANKGLASGIIDSKYFTAVILLIIISSIATPIVLKALYAKEMPADKLLVNSTK